VCQPSLYSHDAWSGAAGDCSADDRARPDLVLFGAELGRKKEERGG
jgi:hypothetical protein